METRKDGHLKDMERSSGWAGVELNVGNVESWPAEVDGGHRIGFINYSNYYFCLIGHLKLSGLKQ